MAFCFCNSLPILSHLYLHLFMFAEYFIIDKVFRNIKARFFTELLPVLFTLNTQSFIFSRQVKILIITDFFSLLFSTEFL
jgi:hypothetical protein